MSAAPIAAIAAVLALAALHEAMRPTARRPRRRRHGALSLLARLGRRLGAPAGSRQLAGRLLAAGRPLGLEAADVMAIKAGAAAVALAAIVPLGAVLPGRLGLVGTLAVPLAAFLLPDVWLRRRAQARGRQMERELPDLLDLLRVALGAGLSPERALAEVARHDRGLLARELCQATGQMQLGVPRDTALATLMCRCPCPGVGELVRTLTRAARHGVPLGDALAAQAREARAARARRIAEQAARAAPQIQLVVALLLVPSVLLLVAAALAASFLA
jgi:tight adherence protein C